MAENPEYTPSAGHPVDKIHHISDVELEEIKASSWREGWDEGRQEGYDSGYDAGFSAGQDNSE